MTCARIWPYGGRRQAGSGEATTGFCPSAAIRVASPVAATNAPPAERAAKFAHHLILRSEAEVAEKNAPTRPVTYDEIDNLASSNARRLYDWVDNLELLREPVENLPFDQSRVARAVSAFIG